MRLKLFSLIKKYSLIVLILCCVLLTGCTGGDSLDEIFIPTSGDYKIHLTSDYYIFRVNSGKIIVALREDIGGSMNYKNVFDDVKARIISEVGYDENFIIAKQNKSQDLSEVDNDTYYWILDMKNECSYGPYNYDEFLEEKKELGVPDEIKLKNLNEYKKDYS